MAERLRFAIPLLLLTAAPAAAQPYVYTGGGVAVFDTRAEQALARRIIPGCIVGSVAFRPGTAELFATCGGTGFSPASKIIVIDPSSLQVTASIGLPAEAQDLAFTPDGSTLALALADGYVAFVDAASKRVLATTFSGTAQQFDGQIRNIAVSPDGRYAFCTNPERNTIPAIDTATFVRMFTLQAAFQPGAIAVTSDSSRLLVAKPLSPWRVDVFDLASLNVVASVGLPAHPGAIVMDPNRNRAYVTQQGIVAAGADVVAIDLNRNAVVGGFSAPGAALAAVDGARDLLYINTTFTLTTIRLTDGAVVGSGSLLTTVLSRLAIAPDGVTPPTDPCRYAVGSEPGLLSSPTVSPGGSNGHVNVLATPDRCTYTPQTDVPWITLQHNGETFAGTRQFDYGLAANHTGAPRTGHVTAAGTTLTFTQAGCSDHRAAIDSPRPGAFVSIPFAVTGWGLNTCAPSGTGVSATTPSTAYGIPRPDVAQAFGQQFLNSGFSTTVTSLPPGSHPVTIELYDALTDGVSMVTVQVFVVAQNKPPFGAIETPGPDVPIVSGVMAMTGWALDDTADLQSVQIYRTGRIGDVVDPATGLVFVGSAPLIAGIRPDVQAAYPTLPHADKAGWGTLVLTNSIADGTYTFTVTANDGSSTGIIGQRTVTIQNAFAQTPFGTIDTPAEFGGVSGTVIVFGWALASPGNVIAADGSAIDVYIDDQFVGHAAYGDARGDIAQAFPGYANSSAAGAHFVFDSSALGNGRHTIAWVVRDSAGHTSGIGSRFFFVTNSPAVNP
jgi:WD40 repeat protein